MHPCLKNPEKTHLWVLDKLGLKYSALEHIVHEDSLSSQVYRVKLTDDSSCILKLCYNSTRYRKEVYYLSHLQDVIPVPKLLHTLDPEEGVTGALVLEDVSGALLKADTMTNDEAHQLGEILARLHLVDVASYGDLSLPQVQRKIVTPIELMKNYLESSLSECKDILDPTLLNQCETYIHAHIHSFKDAEGPHIIHRDYRPGNAIARDGKIRAIIDFEIAMGSFIEEDFGQMEMLAWAKHPHSRTPFLEGYASVRPLPQQLEEVTPVLHLLKVLGALGFTCVRGTWQSKHRHIYRDNLAFIKKFFNS